ncbi:MAG: F0F1 ATP synthase subunit B [Proteobacteria bacterium]|nr:F0F1 ATP synthase subunit B [Desulfobulbaceae bacterium]MBU4152887.1 F0F1 ATP synthase subunit B [Pseudomonadota bacterium]
MKQTTKKSNITWVLTAGMVLLAAAVAYAEGGGHGEAANPLSHEKMMDLLWRTTNFVALVIILVKFGSKPIVSALGSRRMAIADRFDVLNTRRGEVELSYKKYEDKLARIDQDVQSIIDSAKVQAEKEREKIIADANRAAADIKRKAELSVQYEFTLAKKALREEIAEQATKMAEALVVKNFTEADQSKLVSEYLDKVGARS